MENSNLKMEQNVDNTETKSRYSPEFKLKAGIFLAGISGISALIGFGATLAAAKKQDPEYFGRGMIGSKQMRDPGVSLALRALGWGTVYAFTGCGIIFYSIWKLSGAQNVCDIFGAVTTFLIVVLSKYFNSNLTYHMFEEFRYSVGSVLPRIPKNDPPQGRTEFSGLNDLLNYLQMQKGDKGN